MQLTAMRSSRTCLIVYITNTMLRIFDNSVDVHGDRMVKTGFWDSIHVVEAVEDESKSSATYKLTTTVMLYMGVENPELGEAVLSGSLTRQTELSCALNENKTHIANIGRMIEDMETDMRSNLNELYILKTREVINSLRTTSTGPRQEANHIASLNAAVMGHGKSRIIDSEN
jgi:capping protein beta